MKIYNNVNSFDFRANFLSVWHLLAQEFARKICALAFDLFATLVSVRSINICDPKVRKVNGQRTSLKLSCYRGKRSDFCTFFSFTQQRHLHKILLITSLNELTQ